MRRRVLDTVELMLLVGLSAWIVAPLFRTAAASLAEDIDPYLKIPHAQNPALGFLFAAAAAIFAWARRRRRVRQASERNKVPADGTSQEASSSDAASFLAYAGFGLLVGGLLSGDWNSFGALAGAHVAATYPAAAPAIGIGIVIATIALLYRRGEQLAANAATTIADPWIARSGRIFHVSASIAGIAFALAILLLFVQRVVSSWARASPWSLIVLGGLVVFLLWEDLRVVRTQPKPAGERIKDFWQGLAILFGIFAVITLLVETNYRGLTASSAVFDKMGPATRLAFFAMPTVFLSVLVLGLARFAYSGHRVRVFISFHHSREKTAQRLQRALGKRGLIVGRLPFRQDYEHDDLLKRIQHEIRSCRAMVCLPGAQPSFIENEVLVASTLRKFILFVVGEEDPRLPNTAYYGYPVFRLERVARLNFDPIAQLILLVAGNWKASLRHFMDGWTRHLANGRLLLWLVVVFIVGTYVVGAVFALVTVDATEAWRFVRHFHRAYFDLLGLWMILWIWLNAFLIGSVFAMIGQLRARRVLRQDILTGHLTRAVLRQRIGGGKRANRLIACMREKPPLAEHEKGRRRG